MKRSIIALAVLAALLALPPGAAAQGVKKKVYAFDRKFMPFSFVRNQKAVGFEVEVLEAALQGTGTGLEQKPMRSWEQGQAELSSGVVHIASGMTRTDLRDKLFIYPDTPTVVLRMKFFVNRASRLRTVEDLRGQTVAARRDSTTQLLLQRFGGIKVRLYDDDEQALQAVQAGDAVAYLGADKIAWDIIARDDLKNLVVLGAPLAEVPLYYALYKGEPGLRELVDRGLRRIMAEGEYDRIYRKWFVPELPAQGMKDLVSRARAVLHTAQAPRTGDPLTAAVLTRSGNVYTGATVEGPQGGERLSALELAVASAVSAGDMELTAAVVVAPDGTVRVPSARERELLAGYGRGVLVVLEPNSGEYDAWMVSRLLPFAGGMPGMAPAPASPGVPAGLPGS